MTAEDQNLVVALLHHANVILGSDGPENPGRERDLDNVKRSLRLAERIANGNATDDDPASVGELVHADVRTSFGL